MGRVSMNVNGNYIHFCTVQMYVSNCGAKVTPEKIPGLWKKSYARASEDLQVHKNIGK